MSTITRGVRPVIRSSSDIGLRDRPRKAVEDEPSGHVRTVEALTDNPDHHLVAHELTALHDRLGAQPDFTARLHRLPQDVAGRHFGDAVRPGEAIRLRAFARSRRSQKYQIQGHEGISASPDVRECGSSS